MAENTELEMEVSAMKAKMREEFKQMEAKYEKQMERIERLKKSEQMSERAISTLFKKVCTMEKTMGVVEERKSDSELKRLIEGVVRSILNGRKGEDVKSIINEHSGDIAVLKEAFKECLRELEKSDQKTQSMREQLNNELKGQMKEMRDSIVEFLRRLEEDNAKMTKTLSKVEEGFEKDLEEMRKKTVGMIEERVARLEESILKKTPKMSYYSLSNYHNEFQPDFSWTISGIAEMTKQKTFQATSEEFRWAGYDVRARAKLQLEEDDVVHLSVHLSNVTKEVADSMKLIPKVYYQLRSASSGSAHISRAHTYLFGSKFSQSLTFANPLVYKSLLTKKSYNLDDSVVIEVHVEPPLLTTQVHSYDGTLSWAIVDYQKRFLAEIEDNVYCQEGPYFYTGIRGYRVQVVLMLNGYKEHEGRGTSAKVYFLSGEFDDELPASFRHRTTITLVNQKRLGNSICASIERDFKDRKCYELDLGSLEEVEKLIENDTLYCEVKVEAL